MNNWHPKPLRPVDPKPLFPEGDSYTIRKSSTLSPIERQRIQDGTPHTRGGRYRLEPGQIAPIDGLRLYLGGEAVEKAAPPVQRNVDELVKSFLSENTAADEEEDTENTAVDEEEATEKAVVGAPEAPKSAPKAAAASATPNARPKPSTGAKIGAAAGKVIGAAGGAAGAVGRTVASLASKR